MKRRPRHLSIFTGIGGFDLGFEAAGMRTVGQVEIDKFCNRVLERRFSDAPRRQDVTGVSVALADDDGCCLECGELLAPEFLEVDETMAVRAEQDPVVERVRTASTPGNDVMRVASGFVPGASHTGVSIQTDESVPQRSLVGIDPVALGDHVATTLVPDVVEVGTLRRARPPSVVPVDESARSPETIRRRQHPSASTGTANGRSHIRHCTKLHWADVVSAGFPCQDLSVAGRRAGLTGGSRSSLFWHIPRIVKEMRDASHGRFPRFLVIENVPGLFSSHGGADFAVLLAALCQLGALDIVWRTLNARFFGVSQQRRRVFLVADFRGERAAEILYQPEACAGHPLAGGAEGQDAGSEVGGGVARRGGAAGYPEVAAPLNAGRSRSKGADYDTGAHAGNKGRGTDLDGTTYLASLQDVRSGADRKRQNGSGVRDDGIMYTLDRVSTHAVAFDAHDLRTAAAPTLRAESDGENRPTITFNETCCTSPGDRCTPNDDVTHPLAAGARAPAIVQDVASPLSPSLSAAKGSTAGKNGGLLNNVVAGARIRYLTPLEQERCQGFPDGWTCLCPAEGDTWRCVCPDGPRQRALGNAVPVPVATWLGRRIVAVLR